MITFIYTLADPQTGLIRYVGKSKKPITRLKQHLSKSNNRRVCRWVKDLKKGGQYPLMNVVDTCLHQGNLESKMESHYINLISEINARMYHYFDVSMNTSIFNANDKEIYYGFELNKKNQQEGGGYQSSPRVEYRFAPLVGVNSENINADKSPFVMKAPVINWVMDEYRNCILCDIVGYSEAEPLILGDWEQRLLKTSLSIIDNC